MGATEAITAAILGLCEPGDEVLAFDPTYDSYGAAAKMTGARLVPVPLHPPEWTFDPDELRAAITPKTRAILVNSPHNPTGRVLTASELQTIADVVQEHDLIAITDEVYEHLVFDGLEHIPLATLPGMAERTLTISSLGKTFSVTGWKVGWATGPASLVAGVRAAKQFMTFAGATPFQHAGAAALRLDDGWYAAFALELQAKRDHLCAGLREAGLTVSRAAGHVLRQRRRRHRTRPSSRASCRTAPASSRSRPRSSAPARSELAPLPALRVLQAARGHRPRRASARRSGVVVPEARQRDRQRDRAGDDQHAAAEDRRRAARTATALAPARALPSSGPDDHEIISTPARRPRMWSGIVSFHSAPRKMPEMPSAAPASASSSSASQSVWARPKSAIATPHAAAASTIARPLWCTRAAQPLVDIDDQRPDAPAPPTAARPPASRRSGRPAPGRARTASRRTSR